MSNKLVKPYQITLPFPEDAVYRTLTVIHLANHQLQLQGPIDDLEYCKGLLEHAVKRLVQFHENKKVKTPQSVLIKPEDAERILRETTGGGQA